MDNEEIESLLTKPFVPLLEPLFGPSPLNAEDIHWLLTGEFRHCDESSKESY